MNMKLLAIISDGEWHSGEEIGLSLGVSRSAVWKSLTAFVDAGIEVESRKGRGYRLQGGLELLDEQLIRGYLAPSVNDRFPLIEIHGALDSTNRRAMDHALAGTTGLVCLAESQIAGRGRRGRNWVSPFGRNLYMSVVWEFECGAGGLEGLSLAVAVAVARALGELGINSTTLKWPNDLMVEGAKLGGILIELSGDLVGPCKVVIGIGINCEMSDKAGINIDQDWTDLARVAGPRPVLRNELAALVLSQLVAALNRFADRGFADFQAEWESIDALRDRDVCLIAGDRTIIGKAAGITPRGALKLITDQGEQEFSGGELSLRVRQF